MAFNKAVKHEIKLRMALMGPAGAGKTYTALNIAKFLGGPIALIDTEHGSASKYADLFEFDVLELESFHPQNYIDAIKDAVKGGYKVVIIDSLSHAWMGKDGALELVDRAAKKLNSTNTFAAWKDITPIQNNLIDTLTSSPIHIITTMRSKMEYVMEKDERSGKTSVRKVGLAAIQKEGMEFEHDVVGELQSDNTLVITKTRCPVLADAMFHRAGKNVADILLKWLAGVPASTTPQVAQKAPASTNTPTVQSSAPQGTTEAVGGKVDGDKEVEIVVPEHIQNMTSKTEIAAEMRRLNELAPLAEVETRAIPMGTTIADAKRILARFDHDIQTKTVPEVEPSWQGVPPEESVLTPARVPA